MAKVKVINKRQGADLIGANFRNVASETIFSFGNFTVDTNFSTRTVKKYNNTLSSFVKPITLETLNLSEEDSKHIYNYSQEVLLNFDKSDLSTYARFGSLSEVLNVSVEKIILNFPASLYITYQQSSFVNLMSITNYSYNEDNDTAIFTIPTAAITNKFGLVVNYGNSQFPEDIKLRNINISYEEYVIWRSENQSNNDFQILGFTGFTQSNPNLTLTIKGNPFPELSGTTQGQFRYHIKPKPIHFNKFKENLSVLESYLINDYVSGVTAGYKTVFKIPYPSENGGIVYSNKEIVWSSFDKYNVDVDGFGFNTFLSDIAFIGDLYDQFKSDLVARMLVPSSIFDDDNTADEKMKKLIRLYGASFDNIKVFIDALVTINKLSYDKKKNVPDILVKNLARTMGWETIALTQEEDLLEGFFSTKDKKSDELLPAEVDIELWRRILINTNYLFKTKGTRESIMTMLLMVGIPEPFINITEYVYTVTQKINPNTVTVDLSDLPSSTLPYDSYGYPTAPKETKTFYFQVSGNSDSGQAYMDVFRKVGFVLNRTVDNKKSWEEDGEVERIHYTTPNYYQKDSKLVLNTKEVDVTLDIARGIEYDVYKYNVENNYPLSSTGVTKPYLYINIPFNNFLDGEIIFTVPEVPQGDIQVSFNGITLIKGSSGGDTTADYYINPFNTQEVIMIGGSARIHGGGYKDVITLTYVKDQSSGNTYSQIDYVVTKINVNPDGIVIPLIEEPLGEVQLVVGGKTMTKSNTLFTGDYVVNPANPMELIIVNESLKNYLIAHPVVTISYIKSSGYEPVLKKSEVHYVNSFSDVKFYYNGTLNKYTYVLDYEPPDDKAVKIIVNGITLQNGTDFTLNSINRKQVLFNTTTFSLGYIINAFYVTSDSVDQSFNFGSFKLPNLSQITFLEYLEIINKRLINVKNRKTITDHEGGMYPTVQKLYEEYLKRVNAPSPLPKSNGYMFGNVYPFINKFNTFFHKFIEQLLSSTIILKKGGVLIRNTAFTKQKFTYKRGVSFDATLLYLGDDGSEFKKRIPNLGIDYYWSGTTCVIIPDIIPPTTAAPTTAAPTTAAPTTAAPIEGIYYIGGYSNSTEFNDFVTINKTNSNGSTWLIGGTILNSTIYKTTFVNDVGYAHGSANKLYKTTNGGMNWTQMTSFPSLTSIQNITSIYAITENVLIVSINVNKRSDYKTTDGGVTWSNVTKPTDVGIGKMDFYSTTVGYGIVLNNNGTTTRVLRTLNGGSNWDVLDTSPPMTNSDTLFDISCSSNGSVFIASLYKIFKSIDYGETWEVTNLLPTYNGLAVAAYGIKCFNSGVVIAVGTTSDSLNNIVYRSTNGGTSWTLVYASTASADGAYVLNGYEGNIIQFYNENSGNILLVGNPNTKTLKTTNNGLTWLMGGNTTFIYPNHGWDLSVTKSPLPVLANPVLPTPTTTASPVSYDYYLADSYSCTTCNLVATGVSVAFPTGSVVVFENRYYSSADGQDGLVYRIISSNFESISIILTTLGSNTQCANVPCIS